MSAWGNKDFIASPGTVNLSGLTVTGTGTFFANNYAAGDVITFGPDGTFGTAVIKAIANATSITLVSNTELRVGTLTGANTYVVSEKPISTIEGDATMLGNTVFGVSVAEMSGSGGINSVGVTNSGTAYTVVPTVSFVTSTGSGGTASARMKVLTVAVANGGTGFTNGAVVQIGGGTGTSANAAVTTNSNSTMVNSLTIINAGLYSVLPTLSNNIPGNFAGSGLRINLTTGVASVVVTAAGSGFVSADTVAFANVGGTFATVAQASINLNSSFNQGGDRSRAAHAGWVHFGPQYTDASGNVRQKSEVLVAMSSITNDNSDDDAGDVQLPQ